MALFREDLFLPLIGDVFSAMGYLYGQRRKDILPLAIDASRHGKKMARGP